MKVTFSVTFNPTKEDVEKYESADAYIKRMISDSLADFTNPEKWSIEEDTQPEPDSQPEPDTQPNLAPGPPPKQGAPVGQQPTQGKGNWFAGTTWGD
jgi:hypothetical protein